MHTTNSLVNFHFADDITGLAKGLSINELVKAVYHEIQKLGVWLRSKNKIIVFHPKGKSVPTEIVFEINNNDLDTVQDPSLIYPFEILTNKSHPYPAFKIFGFWLDENLSLDYHVSVTSKKISKSLYSLKKVRNILSTKALKYLFTMLLYILIFSIVFQYIQVF